MSRRNKILITVVSVIVVLLLLFLTSWWLSRSSDDIIQNNTNSDGNLGLSDVLPEDPDLLSDIAPQPVEIQNLEADLKAIATTFTERYGSYSNQGNFSNLESVRTLMTLKMKITVDNFIASQTVTEEIYYGITTKAITVDIELVDEDLGRAELTVATQRQEARFDTTNPRTFYQNLTLKLAKDGENWKIDSAVWQ